MSYFTFLLVFRSPFFSPSAFILIVVIAIIIISIIIVYAVAGLSCLFVSPAYKNDEEQQYLWKVKLLRTHNGIYSMAW